MAHVKQSFGAGMAFVPVLLGLAPTLHFHASGAVTFLAEGQEPSWDDDAGVILAVAA